MAYVAVVPSVYNAAQAGAIAGMLANASYLSAVAGDYATIAAAAEAYAEALDTAIGADATLAAAGATVVAASAANFNAAETKPLAIYGLSFAAFFGRASTDATVADWAAKVAPAVKAQYTELLTKYSAA